MTIQRGWVKRCVFATSLLLAALGSGCSGTAETSTEAEAGSEASEPALVRVDGEVYSTEAFAELFGDAVLHYIVTQEVLDEGIPTAFTSEAKRNAAVGIDAGEIEPVTIHGLASTPLATLYEHKDRGGGKLNITGNRSSLGTWNDKASSVDTFSKDIILYEHSDYVGCSLFVQRQKYISSLTGHDFCGLFTGNWNDKTSSVAVAGG